MIIDFKVGEAEAQVQQHNLAVLKCSAERIRYRKCCAHCRADERQFMPHDVRRRGLRVMTQRAVDGLTVTVVVCLVIWLARWRCRKCRRTFSDFPDFRTAFETLR